VPDVGGQLAVVGDNALLLANAGSSNGIAHVRLARRSQ
jgi:hypothetical protein